VPKLHVLITDDSLLNRKMMVKLLVSAGHTCDQAEDGAVAVDKVAAVFRFQQAQRRRSSRGSDSTMLESFDRVRKQSATSSRTEEGVGLPYTSAKVSASAKCNGRISSKNSMYEESIAALTTGRRSSADSVGVGEWPTTQDAAAIHPLMAPGMPVVGAASADCAGVGSGTGAGAESGIVVSDKTTRCTTPVQVAYDIILMDYSMPTMDGPTATRLIRKMGFKGPIYGVTGNALQSDIDFFTSCGLNGVFLKPLNIKAFHEAINAATAASSAAASHDDY
jgi:CheY-like chemotaxis protein